MKISQVYILLFMVLGICSFAQSIPDVKDVKKQQVKLEKAINNNDEASQGQAYMQLGDTYFNQNNYAKSEEFYLKSKAIYEKLDDKSNMENITRKLALAQEQQNKNKAAIENYEKAADISVVGYGATLNKSDASRLKSTSLEGKLEAAKKNLEAAQAQGNTTDLSNSYSNLGFIQIQQNQLPQAEKSLNKAYEIAKNEAPAQALALNQKLTEVLVDQKNYQKAIEVKKKVLQEDFVQKNTQEKVNQIQQLADIYLQSNNKKQAVSLLKNAYDIAVEKGHTLEAKKSVEKLDSLYSKEGEHNQSIGLYQDFLKKLPDLLSKDKSLTDKKILQETEDKISQLEKEKKLQDELIQKKNIFNYWLIGSVVLLLGLMGFIFRTLKKVQIRNKKIALQSLRREMNPHFIFNSLNSVNQFIAQNNELEANQYLTKFSKLMRGIMENSTEDFIPFQQELELLKNYLALEKTRFQDKFNYEIFVDEDLSVHQLMIPGMLIQPFLENAIWHGLRYRETKGLLKLSFYKEFQNLKITIEDNGIGIEESERQKTHHQKQRKGRGMQNTLERIKLLNDLYHKNVEYHCHDSASGVIVEIKILMQ